MAEQANAGAEQHPTLEDARHAVEASPRIMSEFVTLTQAEQADVLEFVCKVLGGRDAS